MKDSPPKGGVILHNLARAKLYALGERPYTYQLVGEVNAHQGDDG